MQITRIGLAVAGVLLVAGAKAAAPVSAPNIETDGHYIVQLKEPAVSSYSGTKPSVGRPLNVSSAAVRAYVGHLRQSHMDVAALVGAGANIKHFSITLNGFSAALTPDQVSKLAASSDVAAIYPDKMRTVSTSYTPTFIGLDTAGGLWSKVGGKSSAGENMVIAVLDSGISPENPAFSDKVDSSGMATAGAGTVAYGNAPATWTGTCDTGPGFSASDCNKKLIGARSFGANIKALIASYAAYGYSMSKYYDSPRDSNGHGTHTASTAAGNAGVPATVTGAGIRVVTSGMAPRARVAMYKTCWDYVVGGTVTNGCLASDIVAAVEQATKDGANVITMSLSGSTTLDAVDVALLGAANAGIFTVAAGGNSGPTASTVNHVSPWVTTVAASSHDRQFLATATFSDGSSRSGSSLNSSALSATPMVLASNAAAAGATVANATLCAANSLDPAKVAGKIVVCDRGTVGLVAKGDAVLAAGGAGMFIVNVAGGVTTLPNSLYALPTMHFSVDQGTAIKALVNANPNAAASMGVAAPVYGQVVAPVVASFSSRGPNAGDPDLMKPDLAAPGVDIIAGYIPTLTTAQQDDVYNGVSRPPAAWAIESGTSMATPHVAGIAAVMMQAHPDWSPAAVRSALMTSALSTQPDGLTDTTRGVLPWGQGSGQIDGSRMFDPGLVYDNSHSDYQRYLCTRQANCAATVTTLSTTDLNQPSFTASAIPGKLTLNRTVKNVSQTSSTYYPTANVPGFDISVSPSSLTLAPGESKSYALTLTKSSAAIGTWQFGNLSWSDGVHTVSSPISARGVLLNTTPSYTATTATGTKLMTLATGFTGTLSTMSGLAEESVYKGSGVNTYNYLGLCNMAASSYTSVNTFTVAPGTKVFTVSNNMAGDFPAGTLVGGPASVVRPSGINTIVTSGQTMQFVNPPAGTWMVCGRNISTKSTLYQAIHVSVPTVGQNADKFKVLAPAKATLGGKVTAGLNWNLAAGKRYFGFINFLADGADTGSYTTVGIDTTAAAVAASLDAETTGVVSDYSSTTVTTVGVDRQE